MLSLLSLFVSLSQAATLKGITWSASSVAPENDGIVSSEANLSDNKVRTPWIEGEEGSGLGSFIKADFGGDKTLSSITLMAGCWYSHAYWSHYSRPKTVTLEFSDGSTQEVALKDEFAPQVIPLSSKKTSSVKIKVKAVYQGDAFNDTAISEVIFKDTQGDDPLVPINVTASTTHATDGDGNYNPSNAADGFVDSVWCEGGKGDGTNDWIEMTYGAPVTISKLKIRNGLTYNSELFKKDNRATAATLTFSDGSTQTIVMKDALPFEQTLTFSAVTTTKVRITFTTVTKGTETAWNDMCVTEATVAP